MADPRLARIVRTVAAGAVAVFVAFVILGASPDASDWTAAAFFAAMGILSTLLSYPVGRATTGSISFLPFLSVALVAPNAAALVSVALSVSVAELVQRRQAMKATFNVSQDVLAIGLAIAAFIAVGGAAIGGSVPPIFPVVVLAATYFFLNKLAVSTVVAIASRQSLLPQWLKSVRGSVLYDALSTPLVLLLSAVYVSKGPAWTALAALPMVGIRQLYRMVFALEKVNEELLQLMVASIEARDPYTSGHSHRVARYARVIASHSGIGGRQCERAVIAALLHDVGKIFEEFAPILRKPGRLSDDEFDVMKSHPIKSAELVAKVSHFADLVPAVRAHHEAWDGSGYPDQLSGVQIPVTARIIALADTIDAMSTSRPYRPAMPTDVVRDELRIQSGRQFDPEICARLLEPASWRAMELEIQAANAEFPLVSDLRGESGRTAEYSLPILAR